MLNQALKADFSLASSIFSVPRRNELHPSQPEENQGPRHSICAAVSHSRGGKAPGTPARGQPLAQPLPAPFMLVPSPFIKNATFFIIENADIIRRLMTIRNIGELCLSLHVLMSIFSMKELCVPQAAHNPHCAMCCID